MIEPATARLDPRLLGDRLQKAAAHRHRPDPVNDCAIRAYEKRGFIRDRMVIRRMVPPSDGRNA